MAEQNRRKFLLGAGAAVAGTVGISSTSVSGASDGPQLVFTEINDEDEYLVVKNTSGEKIDLSGYIVDFGFLDDDEGDEQKGTIEQGTTVDAGSTLKIVADAGKGEVGVGVDREYVMPNDEEEVYAIVSPEGKVVARSDQDKYVGEPETTTTTTEAETTTTTETEETTTEETTTSEEETTTEETTTATEETTTTTGGSRSGSDEQTTTESNENTTTSSSDSSAGESSDKEDC
ncbi:hypothetical protein DMJ13_18975 [halophilic archaeon]|nr:hypothetical protein DMJ13_18975 [halophilic archaeon]